MDRKLVMRIINSFYSKIRFKFLFIIAGNESKLIEFNRKIRITSQIKQNKNFERAINL
jgi:hypothetical protein